MRSTKQIGIIGAGRYLGLAALMALMGGHAVAGVSKKSDATFKITQAKKQGEALIASAGYRHYSFCKPQAPKNQKQKRERLRNNPSLRNKK